MDGAIIQMVIDNNPNYGDLDMDNQHKHIKGYRDLSQAEIDMMNEIKMEGERLGVLCDKLTSATHPTIDGRWVAIGKTHLQQGIMALVRSVAQPESF